MSDTVTSFRSELRDTYISEPPNNGTLATTNNVNANDPSPATNTTANSNATSENSTANSATEPLENEQSRVKKQVYAATGATALEETATTRAWTFSDKWRTYAILVSFFTLFSALSSIVLLLGSNRSASIEEIFVIFLGMTIGGAELGIASSMILWESIKRGKKLGYPFAFANTGLWLLHFPIGIAIASCLYFILGSHINIYELLKSPVVIIMRYFWLYFVMVPAVMIGWGLQLFAVRKLVLERPYDTEAISSGASRNDLAGTFSVRRHNTAARCDICHQDDNFIGKTGFCRRCQRYTF